MGKRRREATSRSRLISGSGSGSSRQGIVLGHSQAEAAKILKVSPMHVSRLLSFGKEKLRERLQAYTEDYRFVG